MGVPDLERAVGIETRVTDHPGTGGRLRDRHADFRVREIEAFDAEPLDTDPGDYPYLVVRATLRGWDTNAFVRALSNAMGISRQRVDWAGTKDRNAVTTQLFTVQGAAPEDIPRLDRADVEAIGRAGRAIEFGDLAGNDFEIVVRDADAPENAAGVTADLRAFGGGEAGVPNWFGQQRFGSKRPVTHEVGLAIVAGDWERAVMTYVGNPAEHEPESTREARTFVEETRDWQAALDRFPSRLGHERSMLHALAAGGSFRDALDELPWNLQRLFVNAAQSYAFNRMVSERLARGLPFDRPVAGDVVCFSTQEGGLTVPDPDRTQRVGADRVETVTRHCERGRAFVTMPLVGTETELAEGDQGDIEREVLDEVGIEPGDFDLPDPYDSTGTRRAALVRTALDAARDGDSLTFDFALPKGSYATALLREYLQGSPIDR
ncbi:MAG: tRNA pseudouridine(13) synthase TruD [Halobacteriaceae archaeon]